ncbi:hypothetical protein Hanom_Chr14g01298441 [Helianthus anomalus]
MYKIVFTMYRYSLCSILVPYRYLSLCAINNYSCIHFISRDRIKKELCIKNLDLRSFNLKLNPLIPPGTVHFCIASEMVSLVTDLLAPFHLLEIEFKRIML